MQLVGLTGGIGAGKSTVAAMLAERGAVVIDADAIVRDLYAPGSAVHRRIVERFGDRVVLPDGSLDRAKIAQAVFADDDARHALNAIVHPEVMAVIAQRVDELKASDSVVVLDVPLLVEVGGREGLDLVVVVDAGEDARIARLTSERGMSADDARARMSVQASTEQRRALADVLIRNDASVDDLRAQVDAVWDRLGAGERA
jgi:dephospho-CoA kinase